MPYRIGEEARWAGQRRQGTGTDTGGGSTTGVSTTTTSSSSTTTSSPTTTTTETTTTPTTTSTTETTSTPNNGDTTSTPGGTTTQGGGTTSAPGQTSTTSMVSTTAVITQGSTVITTVFSTPTVIGGNTGSSKSSSNVGPIVGGVVGGILGLAALLIFFWWIRKRNKNIKLDEDIFDPDRTAKRPGRLGHIDLDDPNMQARPYNVPATTGTTEAVGAGLAGAGAGALASRSGHGHSQSHDGSQAYYNHHGPSPGEVFNYGQQYPDPYGGGIYPPTGQRPASVVLGGPTDLSRGPSDASFYPPSSYPPAPGSTITSPGGPPSDGGRSGGYLGIPAGAMPFSATGSSTTTSGGAGGGGKGQQAHRDQLQIVNQAEEGSGPVVQHQDGGRVQPQQADSPTEVPPAYDSIPRDDEGAGPSTGAGAIARAQAAGPEKGPIS